MLHRQLCLIRVNHLEKTRVPDLPASGLYHVDHPYLSVTSLYSAHGLHLTRTKRAHSDPVLCEAYMYFIMTTGRTEVRYNMTPWLFDHAAH